MNALNTIAAASLMLEHSSYAHEEPSKLQYCIETVVLHRGVRGHEIQPEDGTMHLGGPRRFAAIGAARGGRPLGVCEAWRLLQEDCAPSADEILQQLLPRHPK